jgi:hypothetical protein
VSFYFLGRLGEAVRIEFGARKSPTGTLEGHCWLVRRDGTPWREDSKSMEFPCLASFDGQWSGPLTQGVSTTLLNR